MPKDVFIVGIVLRKRKLANPWVSHSWAPSAILPAAPAAQPWTVLARREGEETVYAGAHELALYSGETAHYRDNLVSGRPAVWVALKATGEGVEVAGVTVDPYEGESFVEDVGLTVEAVPMPPDIQERVAAFFREHHVEQEFIKRKRKRADPDALARRAPRVLGADDGETGGGVR